MGITGVKSIELLDGDGILEVDHRNYVATVKADTAVRLQTSEYYPQTPDFKKGREQWIFQPLETTALSFEKDQAIQAKRGRKIELTLPKKLCGRALCWVEAFSFAPENQPPTGWFIIGQCEPAITDVQWHKPAPDNTGEVIPTGRPEVKYGDTVQLHIDTEGLNGEVLEVQIWDSALLDDKLYSFKQRVVHGKLIQDVVIPQAWRAKAISVAGQMMGIEAKLYARIAHPALHNDGKNYAENLVVKNEFTDNAANKTGNVRVAVDYVPTIVSRYHPCKYLAVTARTKKRELELFTQDEAMEEIQPFKVLDGENGKKKNVEIELKEYNTEECRREEDVHKNHKAVVQEISEGEEPRRFEKAITIEGTDGKLSLDVESGTIATPGTVLENFWPSMVDHTLYRVALQTCRYDRELDIWVYPDMEVEIAFLLTVGKGYEGSFEHKRSQLNGYHKGYGFKYIKSSLSAEATETGHLGWDVQGKSKINGTEYSLNLKSIANAVETAKATYNSTNEYLVIFDPENATKDMSKSPAVGKGLLKINFEVDPPNIAFALGWKFGKAGNDELVPVYTGGLKLDPLIGILIAVDLVPLFGTVGAIGNAVQYMIEGIEWLSNSDAYITFEVKSSIKGEASVSYNSIDGFNKKGKQKLELKAGAAIKAGVESNDMVYVTTTTPVNSNRGEKKPKWKYEGAVQTSFTFTEEVGYENGKNGRQYRTSKGKWDGAFLIITRYEAIAKKKTDHEETVYQYETEPSGKFPVLNSKPLYNETKYIND